MHDLIRVLDSPLFLRYVIYGRPLCIIWHLILGEFRINTYFHIAFYIAAILERRGG